MNLERKQAEVALLEAEAAFAAKKADGGVTNEDRLELRRLRHTFRTQWRQPKPGASPAAIGAEAQPKDV